MHTCSENSIYLQYMYINWHFVTLNPGCANQATTVIACIDALLHARFPILPEHPIWLEWEILLAVLAPRSDRKRACVTIQIWLACYLPNRAWTKSWTKFREDREQKGARLNDRYTDMGGSPPFPIPPVGCNAMAVTTKQ